jgi:hypothetical protein
VVDRDAELREAWYAFQQDELIRIARRWLAALEIEPIYELPRQKKPVVSAPAPKPKIGLLELLLLGAPDARSLSLLRRAVAQTLRRGHVEVRRGGCAPHGGGRSGVAMDRRFNRHLEGLWLRSDAS